MHVHLDTMGKAKARSKRATAEAGPLVQDASVNALPIGNPGNSGSDGFPEATMSPFVRRFLAAPPLALILEHVDDFRVPECPSDARIFLHPSRMLEYRVAAGAVVAVRFPAMQAARCLVDYPLRSNFKTLTSRLSNFWRKQMQRVCAVTRGSACVELPLSVAGYSRPCRCPLCCCQCRPDLEVASITPTAASSAAHSSSRPP